MKQSKLVVSHGKLKVHVLDSLPLVSTLACYLLLTQLLACLSLFLCISNAACEDYIDMTLDAPSALSTSVMFTPGL